MNIFQLYPLYWVDALALGLLVLAFVISIFVRLAQNRGLGAVASFGLSILFGVVFLFAGLWPLQRALDVKILFEEWIYVLPWLTLAGAVIFVAFGIADLAKFKRVRTA